MIPLLVLLGLFVAAEDRANGSIVGRVRDLGTGAPLAETNIRMSDPVRVAVSDSAGAFAIRDVPAGLQWLEVHCSYHAPLTIRVEFHDGATDTLALALKRERYPAFEVVRRPDPTKPPVVPFPPPFVGPVQPVVDRWVHCRLKPASYAN